MIRGTTAQFKFKLPYSKENVQFAEAKFWQPVNSKGLNEDYPLPIIKQYVKEIFDDGNIVIDHSWSWIDDHTLLVKLAQQETLTFSDRYKARVQLRAKSVDGLVFASAQQNITVYPMYGDAPIGGEEEALVILDGQVISSPDDEGWTANDGGVIK